MKIVNGKEYVSLYEYLGKAAGPSLGEEINKIAIATKQPFVRQDVDNPKFTGKVFCYTREFLDEIINTKIK